MTRGTRLALAGIFAVSALVGTLVVASCGRQPTSAAKEKVEEARAVREDESSTPRALTQDERMGWWRKARFGMFIHWGLYAIPAGSWGGKDDYGEWIRHSAKIPIDEYHQLQEQFNPTEFDAEEWAEIAAQAGMKYIVITTKHHDGFALFDTKTTEWDVVKTPFGRDIMAELAQAARARGLKIGWYHSIMDWDHPDYLPRRKWEQERDESGNAGPGYRSAEEADFSRYSAYLHAQVRELLTNYGEIAVMWFDGEWESTWTHEEGRKLFDLVRELQPETIVNNRVDKGRAGMEGMTTDESFLGDFGTPEQRVPETGIPGQDWESCITMNANWGYNAADTDWKSTEALVRMLVDIASKGGNLLLNVGPKADGTLPQESIIRLREIGRWMKANGEAIYDTVASPMQAPPWGRITTRYGEDTTRLYLHVFDWPAGEKLVLDGLGNEVSAAHLLAGKKPVKVAREPGRIVLELPESRPDPHASVIAVDIVGRPIVYTAPVIEAISNEFVRSVDVTIQAPRSAVEIRYTTDGREPTTASLLYREPLRLTETTIVKARSFHRELAVRETTTRTFTRVVPTAPKKVEGLAPGLETATYVGEWDKLPDFSALRPEQKATVATIEVGLGELRKPRAFGQTFAGYLRIPESEIYALVLTSDDGSRLTLDGRVVIDNDGKHSSQSKRAAIPLAAGDHPIRIDYFNGVGEAALRLQMARRNEKLETVKASQLFHVD
jgi:alpha-L-fucosidase